MIERKVNEESKCKEIKENYEKNNYVNTEIK